MKRRIWPYVLALLTLAILGSYLVYTEYLFRAIRADAAVNTRMYGHVQEGLLSVDPDGETRALVTLQREIKALGVPIVLLDRTGQPTAAINLPFQADLGKPADRSRVLGFVRKLDRRNPPISGAYGTIHYGPPPVVRWLRWVPYLQVGGAALLLLLAGGLLQVGLRAERERYWAAMARELAHQMGTPLSSLSGWIEVLELPAEQRRRLADDAHIAREIGNDVERLERVSRRFELIGQKPGLEPVEPARIVDELERYLRPRLPRRQDVVLTSRVWAGVEPVLANRVLLVWALENILKNALDAIAGRAGPGRIRIAVLPAPEQTGVRITISDNGPGVAPELRGRIFEPGVSSKRGGWGVGLSLARRIVEDLHGGAIAVRPRTGGGTTFVVTLRRAPGVHAASADGRARARTQARDSVAATGDDGTTETESGRMGAPRGQAI